MPVNNVELLNQVHFSCEANCDEFRPHPLRPSMCTECNKLFNKHDPKTIPNDECLLQALAHSSKSEKTPDCILTSSNGGSLYLGGYRGVMNGQFLRESKITNIVNTAKGLEIFGPKYLSAVQEAKDILGIHILELGWEDTETWYITDEDIKRTVLYVHSVLKERDRSVLVHCAQGKSRSSTAVIVYVMCAQGMALRETLELVQSKHKMAQPNPHFMKRLELFEKSELLQELRQECK